MGLSRVGEPFDDVSSYTIARTIGYSAGERVPCDQEIRFCPVFAPKPLLPSSTQPVAAVEQSSTSTWPRRLRGVSRTSAALITPASGTVLEPSIRSEPSIRREPVTSL